MIKFEKNEYVRYRQRKRELDRQREREIRDKIIKFYEFLLEKFKLAKRLKITSVTP